MSPHIASVAATMTTTTTSPIASHDQVGGTCPGDGRCDGTGGTSNCNGCPALNNKVRHTVVLKTSTSSSSSSSPPPLAASTPADQMPLSSSAADDDKTVDNADTTTSRFTGSNGATTGANGKRTSNGTASANASKGSTHGATVVVATGGGLNCANCGTSNTPLWRRDDQGNNICNACGTWSFSPHKAKRPVTKNIRAYLFI